MTTLTERLFGYSKERKEMTDAEMNLLIKGFADGQITPQEFYTTIVEKTEAPTLPLRYLSYSRF